MSHIDISISEILRQHNTPLLYKVKRLYTRLFGNINKKVRYNCLNRQHYASGLYWAVKQAKALNLKEITIIEFGIGYGGGLLNLIDLSTILEKALNIKINIYGVDSFKGLPKQFDYRDHPEIWTEKEFEFPNYNDLIKRVGNNATILVDDVSNSINKLLQKIPETAPIGFIALDLDYYSSTSSALKLLSHHNPLIFLPAIITYVDDIEGLISYNSKCGAQGALQEFNKNNNNRFIEKKLFINTNSPPIEPWQLKLYVTHIFDHPKRNLSGKGELKTLNLFNL